MSIARRAWREVDFMVVVDEMGKDKAKVAGGWVLVARTRRSRITNTIKNDDMK